jgi:hypothetical protein
MSEHNEQVALFAWAAWESMNQPELDMLFAIPNGGLRNKAVAAKMRAEGAKAGIPDAMLAVPRGDKSGLFIELKFGKNKPTKAQKEWLVALDKQGYETAVCWGFEEAKTVIEDYLNQTK